MTVGRAVFITATETEPRRYGKPVVIGGILDHLCDRLGPDNVHLVLVGRTEVERPDVAYRRHVLPKPGARQQVTSVLRRVVRPPRHPLQEAALFSADSATASATCSPASTPTWRSGTRPDRPVRARVPRRAGRRRVLYADDLFSERYAAMLRDLDGTPTPTPAASSRSCSPARPARCSPAPASTAPCSGWSATWSPRRAAAAALVRPDAADQRRRDRAAAPAAADAPGIDTLPPLLREPRPLDRAALDREPAPTPGSPSSAASTTPRTHGLDWFLSPLPRRRSSPPCRTSDQRGRSPAPTGAWPVRRRLGRAGSGSTAGSTTWTPCSPAASPCSPRCAPAAA